MESLRGSLRWSSELPLPPENQSYDDPDDGPDDDHDDPDVGAFQQNPTMTKFQFPLWENAGQVSPCKYQFKYANWYLPRKFNQIFALRPFTERLC